MTELIIEGYLNLSERGKLVLWKDVSIDLDDTLIRSKFFNSGRVVKITIEHRGDNVQT